MFQKIKYNKLDARQKEAYNFQKVSAVLADCGYITIKLSSDWDGVDFIAQHKNGKFLKVQLKSRASVASKYENKDLYICFPYNDRWYLPPHDGMLECIDRNLNIKTTNQSWKTGDTCSYPSPPKFLLPYLEPWCLPQ